MHSFPVVRRAAVDKLRGGFTLVELLVVIAIIGTLVGLLLPAVQAARESARLSTCLNNIKQMGLAVLNFHDAKRRFPAGQGQPEVVSDVQTAYSFAMPLLPFIEHQPLFDNIVTFCSNTSSAAVLRNAANNPYTGGTTNGGAVPTFECPSNWSAVARRRKQQPLNYQANWGDVLVQHNSANSDYQPMRGAFTNATDQRKFMTILKITDGTSRTVMLGEVGLFDGATYQNNGGVTNWGGSSAAQPSPSTCLSLPGTMVSGTWATSWGYGRGWRWADPRVGYTGFFTILPPNSVPCTSGGSEDAYGSISSSHAGGANVVMCDASTRFLADAIDCGISTTTPPTVGSDARRYKGQSVWGVWGALGTTASGEIQSMD